MMIDGFECEDLDRSEVSQMMTFQFQMISP